jgi:hypothetical protein
VLIVDVAALVARHPGIGAQRSREAREGTTACHHAIGRTLVLDPGLDGRQHVELVRGLATAAVSHAWYEKEPRPGMTAFPLTPC